MTHFELQELAGIAQRGLAWDSELLVRMEGDPHVSAMRVGVLRQRLETVARILEQYLAKQETK